MGAYAEREKPRLVESMAAVPEFWCDGVGKVEKLGEGAYRILLYRIKRPLDGEGPDEHEVVAAVLTNLKHIHSTLMLLRALADNVCEAAISLLLN
jgi:hypothetical protein